MGTGVKPADSVGGDQLRYFTRAQLNSVTLYMRKKSEPKDKRLKSASGGKRQKRRRTAHAQGGLMMRNIKNLFKRGAVNPDYDDSQFRMQVRSDPRLRQDMAKHRIDIPDESDSSGAETATTSVARERVQTMDDVEAMVAESNESFVLPFGLAR